MQSNARPKQHQESHVGLKKGQEAMTQQGAEQMRGGSGTTRAARDKVKSILTWRTTKCTRRILRTKRRSRSRSKASSITLKAVTTHQQANPKNSHSKSRNRVVAMLRSAKNKYFRSLCGASSSGNLLSF